MLHYLDPVTLSALADQRETIAAARERADAFASAELAAAEANMNGLLEGRTRLGSPPSPDAFVSHADWRDAADRHTFALSRYDRDIAAAEQRLAAARAEHATLLVEAPALAKEYRNAVVGALDNVVAAKVNEAADIATVRESLLLRFRMSGEPVRLAPDLHDGLRFQVQSAGYPDVSWFNASARRDGFTPDKSAAIVAELGIL